MAKKSTIVKGPGPKIRKPVQKKPNTIMKSKRDYRRRGKHGVVWNTISEE